MTRMTTSGKGDVENRILTSAAEMFARYGYNGANTRGIASAAGVNEVTIYRHYPSKRDLYIAALDSELQQVQLRGDMLARIAESGDAKEAVTRTFELISATILPRQELQRLVQYSTLELGEDLDSLLRRHLGQWIEVIARYLEPWVDTGQLRMNNAKALVLSLVAIVLSYRSLHRLFAGQDSNPETMLDVYAEFATLQ